MDVKMNYPFLIRGLGNVGGAIDYLYDCEAKELEAFFILASAEDDQYQAKALIEAIASCDVKVTILAYSYLSPFATSVFCTADRRVLIPDSELMFVRWTEKSYYKAPINEGTYNKNTAKKRSWYIPYKMALKLKVVTESFEDFFPVIMKVYKDFEKDYRFKIPYIFNTDFSDVKVANFIEYLFWSNANEREALIEISSNGGNVASLQAILAVLEMLKIRITTIGTGTVASCAGVLFLQGDRRVLRGNTKILLHNVSTPLKRRTKMTTYDLQMNLKSSVECNEYLIKASKKKTKLTKEQWEEKTKDGKDWTVQKDEFDVTTHSYDEIKKEILEKRKQK